MPFSKTIVLLETRLSPGYFEMIGFINLRQNYHLPSTSLIFRLSYSDLKKRGKRILSKKSHTLSKTILLSLVLI